jgi:hypothetical protein
MQDVVRKRVGFGMVTGHAMKLKGLQRATTHGERFHVTSMHRHVWAMLSSALDVLYRFRWVIPAVLRGYITDIIFGLNMPLPSVRVADLWGVNDGV